MTDQPGFSRETDQEDVDTDTDTDVCVRGRFLFKELAPSPDTRRAGWEPGWGPSLEAAFLPQVCSYAFQLMGGGPSTFRGRLACT